ncbi:MAG TPA: polynucleotide adenylyltransferase PcnB [Nevskiales bacterium]|nr:polynucleotide adenylyltransferase PcnB [Nevskiales bacterium]
MRRIAAAVYYTVAPRGHKPLTTLGFPAITLPTVIARPDHPISRASISRGALKVLYTLKDAGFEAYLVGGGLRDLLLGHEPKDFDVATSARPEEVQALFKRNCRLIGRRFVLAHVRMGPEIIEVATFRAAPRTPDDDAELDQGGRILRDNVYGTREDDAFRRDFTINALFYNIADYSIVDYVGGMADIRAGVLRLIGDAETRYREDPVRMLRAVRFMAKLGFNIHPDTEAPLFRLGPLLAEVPPARLFDEILKLLLSRYALEAFEKLRHYGLFAQLFPLTEAALTQQLGDFPLTLLTRALRNTEQRIAEDKPVTPTFLFAALLWEPVRLRMEGAIAAGQHPHAALAQAAQDVVEQQNAVIALPKRFSVPMREIWQQQLRFDNRRGRNPHRLMAHPRFRAAYDFLLLRAESGEADPALAQWWTEFQTATPEVRDRMTAQAPGGEPPQRRGRRRRRRRRGGGQGATPNAPG